MNSLQEGGIQSMGQLYKAVETETNVGTFMVTRDETGLHVRAKGQEMTLLIPTEVAKATFLKTLKR